MRHDQLIERYRLKPLLAVLALFLLIALAASLLTPTKLMTLLSIAAGLFLYLILPGYFLLLSLDIDDIERIILSTSIGVALIPLILFVLNLFWIRITLWLLIALILMISAIGIILKERKCALEEGKQPAK